MATTRFADHLLTGTHASRPSASAVPAGTLYSCTTHGLIDQSDGTSTWSTYATLGGTETLPASIIDAKGDLIAGTANDTAARLAVGSDGQILTADSASTPGVKWAAAAGGGAMTLLSTTTLSGAGTFDVSSISGSYNDLVCVLIARGAAASSTDSVKWNLNNDSGSNYGYLGIDGQNTTATVSGTAAAVTAIVAGKVTGSTATLSNSFGVVEFSIFGYASTTWAKTCHFLSYQQQAFSASGMDTISGGAQWNSTAAVTRVQVAGNGTANFLTGSVLRIYGRL